MTVPEGWEGEAQPEAIVDSISDVVDIIPAGESRIVKRFKGTKKMATYSAQSDTRGRVTWFQLQVEPLPSK